MMTFTIRHVGEYFSRTCFCTIPAHFVADGDNGERFDGHSLPDLRETVIAHYPDARIVDPR